MGKIIYEPRGRAKEYAPLAANLYRGCTHGCTYCFVPCIPGMRDLDMLSAEPREDVLKHLAKDAERLEDKGRLLLLCFTCDPYPDIEPDKSVTRKALQILAEHGCNVTVLTKGGLRSILDVPILAANDWWYGATMFALEQDHNRERYEPNAAPLIDRESAIRFAYESDVNTWISLEPSLSLRGSLELIDGMCDCVDHWKVGKLNHSKDLPHELQVVAEEMDWKLYLEEVEHCLLQNGYSETEEQGELAPGTYYIKKDLKKYRA